ncbi:MAG: response regulator, partial [Desulfarculaceae bacterium]
DITYRRRLEEQLMHSQKMEAVGSLASGIAHDFNNILQAIGGYSQLITSGLDKGKPLQDYVDQIRVATDRGADLVRQMLTFGRKMEPSPMPVDLNHQVTQAVNLLSRTIPKMIDIETKLAPDLWLVDADPNQFEQVVINLGTNARDAMPGGGRLMIETRNVTLENTHHPEFPEVVSRDFVQLIVSDTGKGMEKRVLEQIYDPFFTTKGVGEGTGLGLSIVYGIVKTHGGHISCTSQPGEGATFNVYLPAAKGSGLAEDMEPGPQDKTQGGHETVLLVDDDQGVLGAAREILEEFGYNTVCAGSGEEAIDIYKKMGQKIDLVLLDFGMPGLGGRKTLDELIRLDPKAKVIIATGYSLDGQVKQTLDAGAKAYVGKPYRLADLLLKVREVLDQ